MGARVTEHIRGNVVGYVALFAFAIGGVAEALPGKNTVTSGDIRRGQVRAGDLGRGAVTNPKLADSAVDGAKVAPDSLTGADVNESSLTLPQSSFPDSAPPNGPAGGDLTGEFPNPEVREAGLILGGDLTGTVAAGQLAPDSVGAAELAPGSVGAAERADVQRSIDIPVHAIDPEYPAFLPAPDREMVGNLTPALAFDPDADEGVAVVIPLPADRVVGTPLSVELQWSPSIGAPISQRVVWRGQVASVGNAQDVAPGTVGALDEAVTVGPTQDARVSSTLVFEGSALSGLAVGDTLFVRVFRDADDLDGNDNHPGDAQLHLLRLRYTANG
jgi:hypothetical protein